MTQRIEKQIGVLSAIKTESHLFQICGKMLRRNFVPSTDDAALEQGESRFHGVCMNVTTDVLFRMADRLKVLV
jgi:hypothetical protein